jgi:hypothetical protein
MSPFSLPKNSNGDILLVDAAEKWVAYEDRK